MAIIESLTADEIVARLGEKIGPTELAAALAGIFVSPAFTGDPTAPTPATSDNDTTIATTAYVTAKLAELIASAPGAMDTLDELAAAMGDDANFATTMTNALALKAPLASPIFTGNPTAPTPSTSDNDTSVATTAFVKAQGYSPLASPVFTGNPTAPTPAAGDNDLSVATTAFVSAAILEARGGYVGINAQVGTAYTPVASDVGKLVTLTNSGAITVSLPQDSAATIGLGKSIDFVILGTGMATFTNGTGATKLPTTPSVSRVQHTVISAIKIAANTWLVTGDVA